MTRVLAFIENNMYIRNFITSGAFDMMMETGEFGLCLSEITSGLRHAVPQDKIVSDYIRDDHNRDLVYRFNRLSIRAFRGKSSTFDIKVASGWPFGTYKLKGKVASHPWIFNGFYKKVLLGKFRNNNTVEKIILEHKPQLVLFPVTGVEATGAELVMLSRKYGFKTFFIINGWDNLSSKGMFPLLPDYLGIWGPQSLLDAYKIQGMDPNRTIMLGCARYEDYFRPGNADKKIFKDKYILFAGSTVANDEIAPLKIFDGELNGSGNEVKLVYRPHPWREKRACFDLFEPESYAHTILDPQIEDDYFGNKEKGIESSSSQNFPGLSYYPSLVNNAMFMISPMSSMTLEAALFDVPCLVLAHNDGYHPIPGNLQAKFRHFEGGKEVPGWFFVNRKEDLGPRFAELLNRFRNESPARGMYRPVLSESMRKYLYHDNKPYAERLRDAVKMILS